MDFTEIYKQTAGLVAFSPGTHFLLTAVQDRVVIRRSDSFQIQRTWQIGESFNAPVMQLGVSQAHTKAPTRAELASAWITHAGWSCDSEYILAACTKIGVVEVFKLRDETWNARIDCGAEGLARAEWAPDGRSILCFSDWGLRVTIWSLLTGTATHIQFPIHPDRGYAFSRNGKYFMLGERHKSKDTLGVYDTSQSYRLVRHFPLPSSSLASMSLSPAGNVLAVWEGPLEYKVYIVTIAGDLLGTFSPEPDRGLGVRSVAWHPSGTYLAVSGWYDKIYILENLTWGPVAVLELQARIPAGVNVWREPTNWIDATQGHGFILYERVRSPWSLTITRPELSKAYPKSGAVQLSFNVSGTLLLARFESAPHVAHIFAFPTPQDARAHDAARGTPKLRAVLIHTAPVQSAAWNPVKPGVLALCTGAESMYVWRDEFVVTDEEGNDELQEVAECVGVPAQSFNAKDIRWSPDGKGLVLLSKETFCCAFEAEEDAPADEA
ncbi:WD40 repeat domain-containing protein [Phanerochaete sordida]|uniref:WD40 repeat domain-containing protein n=1 Tax=Phanerochaete sordida TaxID=48140 RepID=A0A9P3GHB5_9APHY|nr:WD40 repeat domain-containing protein [Phanerochaete sordida]